mgnify:FL=1
MANEGDRSDIEYETHFRISMARRHGVHLPGPNRCLQCGEANDRRQDGYAVCSDCVADD